MDTGDAEDSVRKVIEAPLIIAKNEANNRIMDIIMEYMSMHELNTATFYRDIFSDLVGQKCFSGMLAAMRLQTELMADKQILRIREAYKANINEIVGYPYLYIDNRLFQLMGETPESQSDLSYQTLPIQLQALRVDWILAETEGLTFLNAINDLAHDDPLFEDKTIVMLIEYIYRRYQAFIMNIIFPINLAQILTFLTMVFVTEEQYKLPPDQAKLKVYKLVNAGATTPVIKFLGFANLAFTVLQSVMLVPNALTTLRHNVVTTDAGPAGLFYIFISYFWDSRWKFINAIFIVLNCFVSFLQLGG